MSELRTEGPIGISQEEEGEEEEEEPSRKKEQPVQGPSPILMGFQSSGGNKLTPKEREAQRKCLT